MFRGGDGALQALCGEFESHWLHQTRGGRKSMKKLLRVVAAIEARLVFKVPLARGLRIAMCRDFVEHRSAHIPAG
jgi:hypothetical protein